MTIIAQGKPCFTPTSSIRNVRGPSWDWTRASAVRRRRLDNWSIPQPIWHKEGNITRDRLNCPNFIRFCPGIKLVQQLLSGHCRPCRQLLRQVKILKFSEI
jgi:hypothetical protein